ncbi:hypothetical protein H2203_000179 [Taxawa tesnikishii (nom. ined.)]|nr:hypothetical protein H2203_000179 [Dothideales sp. JES 119]
MKLLSSFIEADGQLLLDVSLYVSFENYRLRTRPAFTRILPWWANYVLPPHRRAAAKARTEHLGVSTIDIDTVHDDLIDKPKNLKTSQKGFEHETEKRARHLLGRQNTVSSMLGKPEHAAAFRLKALSDAFFGPLRDFLGDNEYLLSTDAPSLLDCLAYGYLSLMLYPQMPQDWLATAIRKQYPSIAAYVERLRCDLDVDAEAEKVMALPTNGGKVEDGSNLPWVIPEKTAPEWLSLSSGRISFTGSPLLVVGLKLVAPRLLGFVSTSLALFGYWVFHNTEWPHGERVQVFGRKRLVDYGEAGAALAALGSQLQYETAYQQQQRDGPVQVDVVLDEQTAP